MSALRIALCGNPNVGKSTVFNALTGLRQHTGNWAGKTVDTARGQVRGAEADWTLTDLPGAYSLLSGSPEEMVASDCLTFEAQDGDRGMRRHLPGTQPEPGLAGSGGLPAHGTLHQHDG